MILMLFIKKKTDVYNFANEATIYSCSLNYEEVHQKLSDDTPYYSKLVLN